MATIKLNLGPTKHDRLQAYEQLRRDLSNIGIIQRGQVDPSKLLEGLEISTDNVDVNKMESTLKNLLSEHGGAMTISVEDHSVTFDADTLSSSGLGRLLTSGEVCIEPTDPWPRKKG